MDLDHAPTTALEDGIVQLHALITASQREMLAMIVVFDRRRAWRRDGAASMEQWLCARVGVSYGTAKQWVAAARALEELPATAGAFAEGSLSWDQLRAVLRFATPERDVELARAAPGWSAAQAEAVARREVPRTDGDDALAQRSWSMRWDLGRNLLRFWGKLPAAEGAVVERALDRVVGEAPAGGAEAREARYADALVELASTRLGSDADADRATIVVHVEPGLGGGSLDNGALIASDTVRRIGCDSRVQTITESADGEPIGIGRASRQVPGWLFRQLRKRDGGCRFPGCGRYRWVHAHHVTHWADGGRTDADNLVLLCGYHHRLVHERGWRIDPRSGRFVRPDGREYAPRPAPLRPEVRARFAGLGLAVAGHDPP